MQWNQDLTFRNTRWELGSARGRGFVSGRSAGLEPLSRVIFGRWRSARREGLGRPHSSIAPRASLEPIGEFTLQGIRRVMAAHHVLAAKPVNQARG